MDVARRSLTLIVVTGMVLSCVGCAAVGIIPISAPHHPRRTGVRQEVNGSVYQSVAVVKDVLREMDLPLTGENRRRSGVEICSKYQSHQVWIEVRDLSAETSRIDVRVKCHTGAKDDAREILGIIIKRMSVSR